MAWAGSYSRLKNYETCPKRHYEVDIAKHFKDDTEQLDWGNRVHKAMADAVSGKSPLPSEMKDYQKWIDRYRGGKGEILVEQKYALTRDFQATEYFSPRVWWRAIGDLVKIDGPVALGADWKTGKVLHDAPQLMLLAACIFAHHPQVQRVKTEFVWLKDDCTTPELFTRESIVNEWAHVLPRIKALEQASITMDFPPKPGRLCKRHCPVLSCPFYGKFAS